MTSLPTAAVMPLLLIGIALLAWAAIDLARRPARAVRGSKWAWAIAIVVIGTLGPIVYLIFGRRDA